jgi:hypothetical protein
MQAWLSMLSRDVPFDEHLSMIGAAIAAVAAFCKNFRRDNE